MKIEQNVAYWCKTEELAKEFLQECEQQGYRWWGTYGTTVETSCFEIYKSNTCYRLDIPTNSIFHSSIGWYRDEGYKIVEYKGKQEYPTIKEHMVRGNKVIVRLSNGNVGISNCNPEDKFDIGIGTKLAVERAYGIEDKKEDNEEKYVKINNCDEISHCPRTFMVRYFPQYLDDDLSYGRRAYYDTIYKCIDKWGGDYIIYLIQDESTEEYYLVNKKNCRFVGSPKFTPYLEYNNKSYGIIGEKTNIVDILGNRLSVGDTVLVYEDKKKYGESVICKKYNEYYVIDFRYFKWDNGYNYITRDNCCIIKNRNYKEIKNGEVINGVKYILEE